MRFAVMRHPEVAKPFLVRMPDISFNISANEKQIDEIMKQVLATLEWKPAPDRRGAQQETCYEPVNDGSEKQSANEKDARITRDVDSAMSSELLDDLEDMGANPFNGTSERDNRRGVPLGVGNARRGKLLALALIREHQVRLSRRGNPTKVIEVTDKGWAVLAEYKRKTTHPTGRGSFLHIYWQHKIADHLKTQLSGANITVEDQTTGKAIDVLCRIGNSLMGIEISETTPAEHEVQRNIEEDLKCCNLVIVLTENERHLQTIQEFATKTLTADDFKRVMFSTLLDFYLCPVNFGGA